MFATNQTKQNIAGTETKPKPKTEPKVDPAPAPLPKQPSQPVKRPAPHVPEEPGHGVCPVRKD